MQKKKWNEILVVSGVCLLIGLMVSILYNSNQKEEAADNRDLWEIRMALIEEQEKQQQLYQEIEENERLLSQYEEQAEQEQINSLKDAIKGLEDKAGLSEKTGPGVIITLEPIFVQNEDESEEYPELNAELLQYLINDLNNYGATDIAIGEQRLTNFSPIRNVNGRVYVNNEPLPDLPLRISVLANDHEKLHNHLMISDINTYFALERVTLVVDVQNEVKVVPYNHPVQMDGVEVADMKDGE